MQKISQETLKKFRPDYKPYAERLNDFVGEVGVESRLSIRDYESAVRKWNAESAIGFSEEEVKILSLIYKCDEQNNRFDNDTFVHTSKGGNTAEHPMFMGLAFDHFKDVAGFGGDNFDPASPESLKVAQLSQQVHAMIAVHDVGEVVDVSFAEQIKTGASKKEPQEEELVGPFKFKLAAYAIATNQPELYEQTIRDLKVSALEAKREYFQQAMDGKITGDEFIDAFGRVIGQKIAEAEAKIDTSAMPAKFGKAAVALTHMFEEAESGKSMPAKLLAIIDKYEGGAHYAYFAGKTTKDFAADTSETDPEKRMFTRLFGMGDSASYALANSATVLSQIGYSQKLLIQTFDAADNEPEETRAIAQKLAGAAGGGIMRAIIGLLQKAPPFIDFNATKDSEPAVTLSDDPEVQRESFAQRLESQRSLRAKAMPAIKERKANVTKIDGVMDTKAVIAVFRKAAEAMESGAWRPQGAPGSMIYTLGEELPKAIQVTKEDLKAASKEYPLDVSRDFRDDRFAGQSVGI